MQDQVGNTKRCMIFPILIGSTYLMLETGQTKADFMVLFIKSSTGLQRVKLGKGRGDTGKAKYVINYVLISQQMYSYG